MTEAVLLWNHIALEANRRDHTGQMHAVNQRGPALSARALAMVHIAMHDTLATLLGSAYDEPVTPGVSAGAIPSSAITDPAIALALSGAAHTVLKDLYPAQGDSFDCLLASVQAISGSKSGSPVEHGIEIGKHVLAWRAQDKLDAAKLYPNPAKPKGQHKDDPFNTPQGLVGAGYGHVRHFLLKPAGGAHLDLASPPEYPDAKYLDAYDEVRKLGAKYNSSRDAEQTVSGIYWAYDGVADIGTPPRLYNQIVLKILLPQAQAMPQREATEHLVRSLMLINGAMADAAVEAWHFKFTHNWWRPVVGIREHGEGLGDSRTAEGKLDPKADPFWEPLGAPNSNGQGRDFTPPFPAYPSGHATFGAAAFEMLRQIHKIDFTQPDALAFEFVSDELNGLTKDVNGAVRPRRLKRFGNLIEAMYDNALSRVYLGVHWRYDGTSAGSAEGILTANDKVGGVWLGREIAQQIYGARKKAPPTTTTA